MNVCENQAVRGNHPVNGYRTVRIKKNNFFFFWGGGGGGGGGGGRTCFRLKSPADDIYKQQQRAGTSFAARIYRPLQLRHIFRGISVYYPEAYAVSCPASLVSVYIALIAYVAITFQHILEALLVHDCVYRDRHRSCLLSN